jgi:hypothetical protein
MTIEELQAENGRLRGLLSGDPELLRAEFTREGSEIDIQHWAVRLIAASLWHTFEEEGGPNFISMEVMGLSDKGPIEVTIRPKWGKKTPTDVFAERSNNT